MAESKGGPTRKDTYAITVIVDGEKLVGFFDKMTGGEVDSDEFKYYPGGMAPPVSLGGKVNPGNVVVTRLYRLQRDHDKIGELFPKVGKKEGKVLKQPYDIDGNPYGSPIVYNGTLKRVTPPEADSESSDPGLIELEFTPMGLPTVGG